MNPRLVWGIASLVGGRASVFSCKHNFTSIIRWCGIRWYGEPLGTPENPRKPQTTPENPRKRPAASVRFESYNLFGCVLICCSDLPGFFRAPDKKTKPQKTPETAQDHEFGFRATICLGVSSLVFSF